MHVLELADKLELTAAQRTQTEKLMTTHKADARERGRKMIDAERALDQLFRLGNATESQLAAAVRVAAAAHGEYRLSHLEKHRRMRGLLTLKQIARYDALRGYGESRRRCITEVTQLDVPRHSRPAARFRFWPKADAHQLLLPTQSGTRLLPASLTGDVTVVRGPPLAHCPLQL
jgi:hypothetical protein